MSDRRGAAAIELALALPFMALLLVAAFDFGNLAYTAMQVNAAAHAGAFYAYSTAITTPAGTCAVGTLTSPSSGILGAEGAATSLGTSITTTPPTGAGVTSSAPTCSYSGCPSSSGVVASTGGKCTVSGASVTAGTYAVAYAQVSFTPLLPWAAIAFPSSLAATAVIRYK